MNEDRIDTIQNAAAGMILVAGLIHMILVHPHIVEARGSGLFFLAIGGAQVFWAVLYLKQPDERFETIGILAMTVAPTVLFFITRIWRAPFGSGPEAIDTLGLATVLLQMGAFLMLLRIAKHRHEKPATRAVAIGIAAGLLLYVGGVAAEGVHILAEPEAPHSHDDGGHDEGNMTADPAAGNTTTDGHAHDDREPHGH